MATNQGFKSLLPDRSRVEPEFLYWWLRAHRVLIESKGNGATFKEISKAVTAAIEISLPPIEEQRRIAAVLDAADAVRAKRREAIAKVGTLSGAVLMEMFGLPTGARRYDVLPMIELVDRTRPITYGILKPGEHVANGVPYVRVLDMVEGAINTATLRRTTPEIANQYRRSLLSAGDLLLSIRGHVGRLVAVDEDVEGSNITQDTARLAVVGANPAYVLEWLRSPVMQRWMARFAKGAAVRGLNLTDVKRIPVPLPPRPDQDRFAAVVKRIERTRVSQLAARQDGDILFASLQQRAFAGEL
jgi:type I restriction enzyme S subunit